MGTTAISKQLDSAFEEQAAAPLPEPRSTQAQGAFIPSLLFATGLGLLLFLILQPTFRWWSYLSWLPDLTFKRVLAPALLLAGAGLIWHWTRRRELPGLPAQAAAPVLLFIMAVNWLDTEYSFLLGPLIRGELLLGMLLAAACIRYSLTALSTCLLGITILGMTVNYVLLADGRLLFSDDHPVFLFRLQELKDCFPRIPVYDVMWGAGADSMYIFASGILNVFFLFFPLIAWFEIQQIYSLIPLAVCVVLTPALTYAASRTFRLTPPVSILAALLSVGANLFWYRWGLKYGTLGFCISAAFYPLVAALLYRGVEHSEEFSWKLAAAFVIATSLCVIWPLMGLGLLPALGMILLRPSCLKNKLFLGGGLLILALNLPWMLLFWGDYAFHKAVAPSLQLATGAVQQNPAETPFEVSGEFDTSALDAANETAPTVNAKPIDPTKKAPSKEAFRDVEHELSFAAALQELRNQRAATHPLIWLLFIPGLCLVNRRLRWWFALSFAWLVVLGAGLTNAAPHLELTRMLVLFCSLATIPTALAIVAVWNERRASYLHAGAAVVIIGFLVAGIRGPIEVMGSKRVEKFTFAGPFLNQIAEAAKTHAGTGRVLFTGFVLHDLEKGHLAPLTSLTGVPMVASSQLHNLWSYKDMIPPEVVAQGDAAIETFLDTYSVSAVFAHEPFWKAYFSARPESYPLVWSGGKFQLFTRKSGSASFFLEGAGEILEQGSGGVTLRVDTSEALITFKYFTQLESTGCSMSPELVIDKAFIRLQGCTPGETVIIRSKSFFRRIYEILT